MNSALLGLSIVIPCYERSEYLSAAIKSVLSQGYDVEVIVLDNASTSGAVESVARSFTGVSYVKNDYNLGLFGNWNKAVKIASSPYVLILGDDDQLVAGYCEAFFNAIKQVPNLDLFYSGIQLVDEVGSVIDRCLFEYPEGLHSKADAIMYASRNGFGIPTVATTYRRSLFDHASFDEQNMGSNDWWLLYTELPWSTAYSCSDALVLYRKHDRGASDVLYPICTISILLLYRNINVGGFSVCYLKLLFNALMVITPSVELEYRDNYYYLDFRKRYGLLLTVFRLLKVSKGLRFIKRLLVRLQ